MNPFFHCGLNLKKVKSIHGPVLFVMSFYQQSLKIGDLFLAWLRTGGPLL